jgi:hypothetical protein
MRRLALCSWDLEFPTEQPTSRAISYGPYPFRAKSSIFRDP